MSEFKQLFISTHSYGTITINNVNMYLTVMQLQQLIINKLNLTNLTHSNFRLISTSGKPLLNNQTLQFYNDYQIIENNSTLNLLMNLNGGKKKKRKEKNLMTCMKCGVGCLMADHVDRYYCGKYKYEKELQDLIKEITELMKSLNLKHKLALKERKEVVDKMLKMVNEFSEHIDKEIGDNFNSKFLELNLKLKELNTQSDNIKNARHYVKGTLDQEDLVQVLSLKNTLVHRLEELNNRDILCCETDDCLEFKIKDNILEQHFKKFQFP
ncbi:hypothetical protein ABK040_002188 [Willaertia magna]